MLNQKLAKHSKCSARNSRHFYECLRRINPYFLTGMQLRMFPVNFIRIILFGPVDEKLNENSTQIPFITQTPEEIYDSGNVAKVPIIFSKTSGEADIPSLISTGYGLIGDAVFKLFWQGSGIGLLELMLSDNPAEKMKLIDKRYFSGRNLADVEINVFDNIITDRFHGVGTHKAIQRQSQISTTYAMLISGPIQHGLAASVVGAPTGPTLVHADDVFLIFNSTEVIKALKTTDSDYDLTKALTEVISHFAKYRTTNFTRKSQEYEDWPAVTNPCDIQYWNVSKDSAKMTSVPKITLRNYLFWQNLGLVDTLPNPYNC
ncbi:unnamed protein product [Allacma fusca]|uniref:Carboxylesterase type B domain-containing protein n=1 Tax=Allacma fusca TaxID=39272 RepID=A0A8J2K4Q5_9HEXA|nr:unnamed protein product [Allacma fusca]